jgi:imidazolonepropionase-like amidohydrolase
LAEGSVMSHRRTRGTLLGCAAAALTLLVLHAISTRAAPPSTTPPTGLRDNTPAVHAFTGARLVVSPGKTIEHGVLVIRDGVVTAAGDQTDVTVPPDARVWDVSGRTIYPGFIDAYSELTGEAGPTTAPSDDAGGSGGAKYWNSRVTPETRADRLYRPDAEMNKKLRGQGFVARLIAPGRGVIKGTGAVVTTADAAGSKTILKPQATLHATLTVPRRMRNGEEDTGDNYPNSPMGAYALFRQAMYDAKWYAQAWDVYHGNTSLPRPEQNQSLEALQRVLPHEVNGADAAAMPVVIDTQDELYDLRADRIGKEFGLNVIIHSSGGREYRRIDEVAATKRPVIVQLNFPRPPNVATPEAADNVSLEELMEWDLAPENAGRLAKAGVEIAISSNGLRDRAIFLTSLRRAVTRGLSKDAALKALTVTPAKLFGLDQTLGTLEPGKSASFVITTGDVFTDRTSKVVDTWIDGKRYENGTPPLLDVRGTWAFTLGGATSADKHVTVRITGDLEKQTGKLYLGNVLPTTDEADKPLAASRPTTKPTEADLASLSLVDARLGFAFKSDLIGRAGFTQVSATVTGESMLGSGVAPDGSAITVVAMRTNKYSPRDDARSAPRRGSSAETEEVAPAEDETAPAPPSDPNPPSETTGGGTTRVSVPAPTTRPSSSTPGQSASAGPDRRAGSTTRPVIRNALFPVNFPLGDYGRNSLPKQPKTVIFKDATVWTSTDKGILKNATVIVKDGKIASVGDSNADTDSDAVVVDCKGKHLSPGIIDCHSHIATDGGVNESGRAISAMVRIGDFIDPNDISIYRQLGGGVTAANILHGSANPIGGQNQVIKHRWGAGPEKLKFKDAPPGIKFALGENVKQSNWGERYNSRYPQTRMGVEQIVRDEFKAAQDYRRAQKQWNETKQGIPPRHDLELEAIAEILEGTRLIHCHSYRQDEILALVRTCDAFGVRIGAFHHVLEGYKIADVLAKHGAGATAFADWWAYKIEAWDAIPYDGALLYEAGVVTSFNSDDAELGRRLNTEAGKAVKYGGVPEEEALKFVTLNPAKQLHIDKWVGSIEPGKDADLALWNGSPLSTLSRCEQTWIDGRKYFDRDEDAKQREQMQKMRVALIQRVLSTGETPGTSDEPDSTRRVLWPDEDEFD